MHTNEMNCPLSILDSRRWDEWEERLVNELSDDPDEAREWIFENCDSYQKLPALLYLFESTGADTDWLPLLGEFWTSIDNFGPFRDDLLDVLTETVEDPHSVIPELMTSEERMALDALPDQIKIYRGCGRRNRSGFSWTLDRDTAIKFPFNTRYYVDEPILLTTIINKTRVAALKLDRNEQEVIAIDLPEQYWTEEKLAEPDFAPEVG